MTTTATTTRSGAGVHHMADPARYPDFDGRSVRVHRVRQGLTAPELLHRIRATGYKLGLSGLTRIERGGRTTAKTAQAIAEALQLPMDEFATEPKTPPPPVPATPALAGFGGGT